MGEVIRTEGGLYVPASAVQKKRRTMLKDTFKKLVRFHREFKHEGIGLLLACPGCKTTISLHMIDQVEVLDHLEKKHQVGGRPALECKCTVWTVRL